MRDISSASRMKRSCKSENVMTKMSSPTRKWQSLNNYILTCLVILDVVVMKLDTILTYFTELVDS
jgi:hypothetical protein